MEPPEIIWMQWNGDGEPDGSPVAEGEVTWCREQVFRHDVKYIRADVGEPKGQPVNEA